MQINTSTLKKLPKYFNPRTKSGLIKSFALLLVIVVVFILASGNGEPEEQSKAKLQLVTTQMVSHLSDNNNFELIGFVEAKNQTNIESETSGRITSVNVELGQKITAGTVIARMENASEYASLLQAEGAYESALASAAQNDISITEAEISLSAAKNNAVSVYRTSFSTFSEILQADIDDFFANPQASTPGVRIDGGSDTEYLNMERVSFEALLHAWKNEVDVASLDSDHLQLLRDAEDNLTRLNSMLNTFITRIYDADVGRYTKTELETFASTLEADRTTVNTLLTTVNSTVTTLNSVQETLNRIQIGGTSQKVSKSSAQIKQALGVLRAAQANYSKTILRTSIPGIVNSLNVKVGDFIGAFTTVSTVANNIALEITTYVGDEDRSRIGIGSTVIIEKVATGIVTAIAPAVDQNTHKVEVKISTESELISNGDSVSLSILQATTTNQNKEIRIPLTSVKLTSDRAYIFTVDEDILISHEIELGKANGSYVSVLGGITNDWEIVVDARGLLDGRKVSVVKN